MGRELKQRWKELTGRKARVSDHTVEMGRSLFAHNGVSGLLDHVGVEHFRPNRPAKLDCVTAMLATGLGAGEEVTVTALVNWVPVGSGTISENEDHTDFTFETEDGEEVLLDEDSVLTLEATKTLTSAAVVVSARATLRLSEK